ncbi:MAG TPA: hypothetical protein PK258_01030 [Fervidobacterium sp.]|nr:hypothetical protein [Fervidobacterium sp.]HOL04252.1 hypothetical protein [Fervidobacterium sp.]HON04698.1 hypothetical protein [Fervidobacterium sp.]HPC78834.1 hypothetical protein [Fervidobacterium sp.]HRB91054.1 hypothetical protein [Fervidobacterium sp.]
MSKRYLVVISIVLIVVLSSCVFFQAGSPPVSLYWHFNDPGLSSAYFAYDPESDILFIRGDAEGNPSYTESAIAAVRIKDKQILWRKVHPISMRTNDDSHYPKC